MAKIIANLIDEKVANKTKEEGLNRFNVSEFVLSAKTNTQKKKKGSHLVLAMRDILLEKDFAFEEVNSFPFILFNDIKRILHLIVFLLYYLMILKVILKPRG